jgi:hypothetical protein
MAARVRIDDVIFGMMGALSSSQIIGAKIAGFSERPA